LGACTASDGSLLLFGGGPGDGNQVTVVNTSALMTAGSASALGNPVSSFRADGGSGATGARVAGPDQTDGSPGAAVSFSPGGTPGVLVFKPADLTAPPTPTPTATDFVILDPSFIGGVYVN